MIVRISLWLLRYTWVFHIQLPQNYWQVQNCHSHTVLKLQSRHLTPPQPHSHADFRCITTAVVEIVSCVDANANPGCHINSTYCPLYRRRTKNIISSHKRRCHCVHQCEPCLNIQFLPCTREDLFDVVENSPHESSIWRKVVCTVGRTE